MSKAKASGHVFVVARKYIVQVQHEVTANSLAEAVGKLAQLKYDDFSEYGEQIETVDETAWLRDAIENKP